MKRLVLFLLFMVNLQIVIQKDGVAMTLFSDTYAQHMDLEGGNYDCLDEEIGWYRSLIPCDGLIITPDETYAECSWCHERFSTSEIWDHEYVCPERERQSQNPWANDGESNSNDGGGSSGGGYSGGNSYSGGGSSSGSHNNSSIVISKPNVSSTTPIGHIAAALAGLSYKDSHENYYQIYLGKWMIANEDIKNELRNLGMVFEDINGYKAELFVQSNGNQIIGYVMAFAGTDGFWALNDCEDDIANALGWYTGQYQMAWEMAYILDRYAWDKEVTFVGHSLGGGLAALASMLTGRVAITFNAASVAESWKTRLIEWNTWKGTENIWNYVTDNDLLTSWQNSHNSSAEGTEIIVPHQGDTGGHSLYNLTLLLQRYR